MGRNFKTIPVFLVGYYYLCTILYHTPNDWYNMGEDYTLGFDCYRINIFNTLLFSHINPNFYKIIST
jgi:hypothetical protein